MLLLIFRRKDCLFTGDGATCYESHLHKSCGSSPVCGCHQILPGFCAVHQNPCDVRIYKFGRVAPAGGHGARTSPPFLDLLGARGRKPRGIEARLSDYHTNPAFCDKIKGYTELWTAGSREIVGRATEAVPSTDTAQHPMGRSPVE